MGKIRALFLAANPQDSGKASLDKEIREITKKIRAATYRDSIQLVSVWAVRPDDLIEYLNLYKPEIVHFGGHGSRDGEIILVDRNENAKPVSADTLKELFTTLKDNIQVVILNACFSEIQAKAIVQVIDCAIGMTKEVDNEAAITFISSFYRAIGFGRSVQDAFEQGKLALMLEGTAQEHVPVLLVRPGVDPSRIILVRSPSTISTDNSLPFQTQPELPRIGASESPTTSKEASIRVASEANQSLAFLKKQIIELNGKQVLRFQFRNNSDYMLKFISAKLVFMADAPLTLIDINRSNKPRLDGTLHCTLLFSDGRDGAMLDPDKMTDLNLTIKRHLKEDDIAKITSTRLGYIDFRCFFHQTEIHFHKDV